MVIKNFTFTVDDNFLNTRPGSPPDFPPSPEASPRACIGCIGIISRFDVLQLGDGSRDGVAVEEMQDENPGGRNGSAGIAYRIGSRKRFVMKVCIKVHTSRFYFFALPDRCSKALKFTTGLLGVQTVKLMGDPDQIEVTGDVDVKDLTTKLSKKVRFAEIVSVSEDKIKEEKEENTDNTNVVPPVMCPCPQREIVCLGDP